MRKWEIIFEFQCCNNVHEKRSLITTWVRLNFDKCVCECSWSGDGRGWVGVEENKSQDYYSFFFLCTLIWKKKMAGDYINSKLSSHFL